MNTARPNPLRWLDIEHLAYLPNEMTTNRSASPRRHRDARPLPVTTRSVREVSLLKYN
jgi:hypothetical protein